MAQVVLPQQTLLTHAPARARRHDVHRAFVIVQRVVMIVVMLVVAAALVLGTLAHTSGTGAVRLFGREVRPVLSGSMTPAYRVGDAVIIRVANAESIASIHEGDVITFRVPGRETLVVTHRVAAIHNDGQGVRHFVTKGDANSTVDDVPVDGAHVIGVVSGGIPELGHLMNTLEQRRTLFVVLLSFVLSSFALVCARKAKAHAPDLALSGADEAALAPTLTTNTTQEISE